MPVEVDASTPARVTQTSSPWTPTTAAFSPPPCLLVATAVVSFDINSVTISNNGAALSWSLAVLQENGDISTGLAGIWYAALPAGRAGMAVTATASSGLLSGDAISLKVYVVTGADLDDPIGGTAHAQLFGANNRTTDPFTVEQDGSLGIVTGMEWSTPGTVTSSDTVEDAWTASGSAGMSGYKSLGGAGSSATFNIDAPGSSNVNMWWATAEIKAAPAAGDHGGFFF